MTRVVRRLPGPRPRVLLTRDDEGCRDWSRQLAALGIDSVALPCLEHVTTRDPEVVGAFLQAMRTAQDGDWLVFTSRRGVLAAAERLGDEGCPPALRVAAVGPSTAATCRRVFGRCDLEPSPAAARGGTLVRALLARPAATALLCVARDGRRDLEEQLPAAGWRVARFDLYETRAAGLPATDAVATDERTLAVDAVFLASPSAVSGLLARAEVADDVPLLAIGPTTAAAIADAGRQPAGVAASPGLGPLADLLRSFTQDVELRSQTLSEIPS